MIDIKKEMTGKKFGRLLRRNGVPLSVFAVATNITLEEARSITSSSEPLPDNYWTKVKKNYFVGETTLRRKQEKKIA